MYKVQCKGLPQNEDCYLLFIANLNITWCFFGVGIVRYE